MILTTREDTRLFQCDTWAEFHELLALNDVEGQDLINDLYRFILECFVFGKPLSQQPDSCWKKYEDMVRLYHASVLETPQGRVCLMWYTRRTIRTNFAAKREPEGEHDKKKRETIDVDTEEEGPSAKRMKVSKKEPATEEIKQQVKEEVADDESVRPTSQPSRHSHGASLPATKHSPEPETRSASVPPASRPPPPPLPRPVIRLPARPAVPPPHPAPASEPPPAAEEISRPPAKDDNSSLVRALSRPASTVPPPPRPIRRPVNAQASTSANPQGPVVNPYARSRLSLQSTTIGNHKGNDKGPSLSRPAGLASKVGALEAARSRPASVDRAQPAGTSAPVPGDDLSCVLTLLSSCNPPCTRLLAPLIAHGVTGRATLLGVAHLGERNLAVLLAELVPEAPLTVREGSALRRALREYRERG